MEPRAKGARLISWGKQFSLVWMLTVLFSASSLTAADPKLQGSLEKVTLIYSSISGTMAPLWVTYETGIFRKHGLDAQLLFVEGGSPAVKALVSSKGLVAQVGGAAVLQNHLKGSDVVMIAGVLNTMPYQFIVDKNIKRPDQLRGKAVAVSRFGGSSDFATRYAIERFELVPEKDVTFLEIGSQPARIAALKDGRIQGTMLSVPETLAAKKEGFSSLADLKMLGLEYQHTGLATSRRTIETQADTLRKILRAYVEGIHYYKTHRNEALKILQGYLRANDMEDLTETYEVLALTLLPEKPYPTLRGIQVMLQQLAKKNPKARSARPEQFADMTLVKELDNSGFIDGLYKTQPTLASAKGLVSMPAPKSVVESEKPAPVLVAKPDLPVPVENKKAMEPPLETAKAVSGSVVMPDRNKEVTSPLIMAKPLLKPGIDKNDKKEGVEPAVTKAVLQSPTVPDTKQRAKPSQEAAWPVSLPAHEPGRVREHRVAAGDTLSHLALRYYRDAAPSKWMKIYEANRQTIKNPNYIYIGQKIIIPPDDPSGA